MMVAKQEHSSSSGERLPLETAQPKGMSWPAMLAWIFGAFVLAGFIAYRLVIPFFHRG